MQRRQARAMIAANSDDIERIRAANPLGISRLA